MDRTPFLRARRFLVGALLATTLLLTGCDLTVTDITPSSLPENPSQLYTITARVTPKSKSIQPGSVRPLVIIDGSAHPMQASGAGGNLWEYDYPLPAGRTTFSYYILVDYRRESDDTVAKQAYTELKNVQVAKRYVLTLEVNRAPIGARVGVLGRGFAPADQIYFDGQPARTVFESPTSLAFFVPNVGSGRNYAVSLVSASGTSTVGTFRVDSAQVSVSPASLTLAPGQTQPLTFSLGQPAPTGGLLLDITTDVPDSVIMPEVVVPEGQTSVTINVQGGSAGSGHLFLKGFGEGGEIVIPVSVR